MFNKKSALVNLKVEPPDAGQTKGTGTYKCGDTIEIQATQEMCCFSFLH